MAETCFQAQLTWRLTPVSFDPNKEQNRNEGSVKSDSFPEKELIPTSTPMNLLQKLQNGFMYFLQLITFHAVWGNHVHHIANRSQENVFFHEPGVDFVPERMGIIQTIGRF